MGSGTGTVAASLPVEGLTWPQRRLVEQLGRLQQGSLEVDLGRGRLVRLIGPEQGPAAQITVVRPAALLRRLFWRGDLGFAEAYMDGDWDTVDPARLLELFALNLDAYAEGDSRHPLAQILVGLRHRLRRNSRSGSRRNIAAHYDLGNDFYAQWLDPGMSYSAALFAPGDTLFEAQERKYGRMLSLLDARPGQHILEIGCGWGGFAEHAARRGFKVTGITLSREQLAYAQARIARAGLSQRVDLRLCDYRDLDGTFDHIVSIEMFEAVGEAYWSGYFAMLARRLRRGGRAALQVITIDESQFDAYASNPGGFIQHHIFPGGMLPTRTHLHELAADAGLSVAAMDGFAAAYADTLAAWHAAFNGAANWLERHGYDERFRRMWRYYLAFCEGGFRAGLIDVVQCRLVRG